MSKQNGGEGGIIINMSSLAGKDNYDVNNDSVSCNLLWILQRFGFDFDRMQQQQSLCDDFIFRIPSLKAHISPLLLLL